MTTPDPKERLLTVPEFARQMRISTSLAYRLVADGTVPALRLSPRTTRIRSSVIDRLGSQEVAR